MSDDAVERLIRALASFDLPRNLPETLDTDLALGCLRRDKKFPEGRIRFVLLRALGDAFVSSDVTMAMIERALADLR